jgi:tight adherence protein C
MSPFLVATVVTLVMLVAFAIGWMALPSAMPASGVPSVFAAEQPAGELAGVIGRLSRPTSPSGLGTVRRELAQAGFRGSGALELYLASRTLLALGLPVLGLAFGHWRPTPLTFLGMLLLAAVGYYLPRVVVAQARSARQHEIRSVLPDALDMLVACVESGLGVDAALRHIAHEFEPVSPTLAGELDVVTTEMQAGLTRAEAMARLDARVGVDEVTALVNVLGQGERYGAGIAESIRAHARMSRRRRLVDAERRAAEASPKLTVVMVLFVLPPLFIVLVGPTVIQVITEVIPMLEGR